MIAIAILLGLVQALTEFLPISSSAHLLIIPWLFNFPGLGLAFDASLHIGTSTALIWYFWSDFVKIVRERGELPWMILIASIPGGVVGFFGEKIIDQVFHEGSAAILISAIGILVATTVIWVIDRNARERKTFEQLVRRDAMFIGIGQALALIPGVSRSGATIAAGLAVGLKREEAARFSFLIGTPMALGAGLYKMLGIVQSQPTGMELAQMGVGILVSALGGFIVIRWLLAYLKHHDLRVFLLYRAVFAVLVLIVLWQRW
ncbi:undecaprenyl-diphosphate phosphatase [bacterium]|nr:undecaprenyl-diphosphate phosphatase [bacterium]